VVEPAFEGPAPSGQAVLDPFSVYAKGEDLLRQELNAMSEWHLRNILRAYGLLEADAADLQAMPRPELAERIVLAVRERLAGVAAHA
jgi:hypothetical protein